MPLRIDGTQRIQGRSSVGGPPPSRGLKALLKQAAATATPTLVYRRDRPLRQLHNAHRTNTVEQMKQALAGPFSQLECDVRGGLNPPHEIECRHDAGSEPGDNLTLEEWLAVGKASGRVLKLDVKESGRLEDILKTVEASGVPPERLNINLSDAAMRQWGEVIRRRFPGALLSLNPKGAVNDAEVKSLTALARRLGPPCTFVVRNDLLSDSAIAALEKVAPVSVWNDPGTEGIDHPERTVEELKRRGCTGVIDIRKSTSTTEKAKGLLSSALSWVKGKLGWL